MALGVHQPHVEQAPPQRPPPRSTHQRHQRPRAEQAGQHPDAATAPSPARARRPSPAARPRPGPPGPPPTACSGTGCAPVRIVIRTAPLHSSASRLLGGQHRPSGRPRAPRQAYASGPPGQNPGPTPVSTSRGGRRPGPTPSSYPHGAESPGEGGAQVWTDLGPAPVRGPAAAAREVGEGRVGLSLLPPEAAPARPASSPDVWGRTARCAGAGYRLRRSTRDDRAYHPNGGRIGRVRPGAASRAVQGGSVDARPGAGGG